MEDAIKDLEKFYYSLSIGCAQKQYADKLQPILETLMQEFDKLKAKEEAETERVPGFIV